MPVTHEVRVPEAVWSGAVEEFRRRQVTSLRLALVERGVDTDRLEELLDGDAPDETVRERMRGPIRVCAERPGVSVLLAAYLLLVAREKWESSTSWPQIRRFLQQAQHAVAEVLPGLAERDPDEAAVVSALIDYAGTVTVCTQVENALNCSCPTDVGTQAREVVRRADLTLATIAGWPPASAGPASLLSAVAGTDRAYYSSLTGVADSVRAVVEGGPDQRDVVQRTVRVARDAELHDPFLPQDVYGTELRAHRLTLEALDALADRPWLHVDSARVVYVYPFCSSADEATVLREVQAHGADWRLSGLRPVSSHALRLTDMWEPSSSGRGTYHGWVLELPEVTIGTTDARAEHRTLRARSEVRFSSLGNHHLRLELTLEDAHVHYVNQALRRAMDVMGFEEVQTGHLTYRQLVDYAHDMIDALRQLLEGKAAARRDAARRDSKDTHVVLSLRGLSVGPVDGPRTPADGEAVIDPEVVGGSVLRQPVRQPAATLEEWVRYPLDVDTDVHGASVLRGAGFRGDVVVRTANTTVLAMTGTPDFLVRSYEESAEFVATLPVLLAHWRRQVGDSVSRAQGRLHRTAESAALYAERQRLQDRIARIRADVAGLHSPALTRTVMGRQFLDRLAEAARLAQQEAHLTAQIDYAIATQEQYVTASDQSRQEQDRRTQRNLGLLGGVLGVSGIADAASLANSAFSARAGVVWTELAVLAVLAVLVVLLGVRRR